MNLFGFATEESIALHYERLAVRRTANHIGLGLILFNIITLVAQVLFLLALGKKATAIISDPAGMLVLNIVLTLLGFLIAAFFISGLQKRKIDSMISFGKPRKGTLIPAIMVGIGFCYTANIALSFLQNILKGFFPLQGNDFDLPTGPFGFVLSIIAVAVFPALLEEFLFRGAIMGSLMKFGKPFAIFTSAILFGLMHGNLVQIPFAFLVGLVSGFAVVETNSIWTGVFIHFLNNFLSAMVQYSEIKFGEDITSAFYMLLLATMIMVGFFGIYLLSRKNPNLLKYSKTIHNSSPKKRFAWFCGAPSIIVYFVIIGLEVMAVQFSGMITG